MILSELINCTVCIPNLDTDIPRPAPLPESDAEALRKEMEAATSRMNQQQTRPSAAEAWEPEVESPLRDLFAPPLPPPNVPKPAEKTQPIGENKEDSRIDQEINALMASIQQQAQALVSNEISAKGALSISLKRQAEELKKTAQNLDELLTAHSQISPSEDFKKASFTILEKIRYIAANTPISKGAFPSSSSRNLRDLNAAIKQVGEILAITPPAEKIPGRETDEEKWERMQRTSEAIKNRELAESGVQEGKTGAGENVVNSEGAKPEEITASTTEVSEPQETDPVRIFIRRYSDKLGDPNEYEGIRYIAVKKESLAKGSYKIEEQDEIWFDNYEDFRNYLSSCTPSEMKMMKEIRDVDGIPSLNIAGGRGAEKDLWGSISLDPKLEKAMYSRGLLRKSLFDRIIFGEYKAPKER